MFRKMWRTWIDVWSLSVPRANTHTNKEHKQKPSPPQDLKVSCPLIGPLGQMPARLPELLNPLQGKGFWSLWPGGFYSTVHRTAVTLPFIVMTTSNLQSVRPAAGH